MAGEEKEERKSRWEKMKSKPATVRPWVFYQSVSPPSLFIMNIIIIIVNNSIILSIIDTD